MLPARKEVSEDRGRGVLDFSMKALTVPMSMPRLSKMGSRASLQHQTEHSAQQQTADGTAGSS